MWIILSLYMYNLQKNLSNGAIGRFAKRMAIARSVRAFCLLSGMREVHRDPAFAIIAFLTELTAHPGGHCAAQESFLLAGWL